jgi:hypothetical protein
MRNSQLKVWFYIALTATLSALCLPAQAKIFVCKDQKNHITYQQEPCPTKTIRILQREPALPIIEQQRARERIDKANASYEAYAAKTEVERLQAEKLALERENLELEKRVLQLKSQEYVPQPVIINPNFNGNRYLLGNRPFGFKGNQFNGQFSRQFGTIPYGQAGRERVYNNEGFRLRLEGGGSSNTRSNTQNR